MATLSSDQEIGDIRYRIGRINIELNNLKKTVQVKKRNKVLSCEGEESLQGQISEKEALIKELETQIRKIENEKIRSRNLGGESPEDETE